MRIVITGATGNVGSAVVRRLLVDGHDLTGVVRRPPAPSTAAGDGGPFSEVSWVSADLSDDSSVPLLRDAFTGADVVVHLVRGFQPSHWLDYLEELGVGGTSRLLGAVEADRSFAVPFVHADDVADAVARAVGAGAPGPFNLAAAPVVTAADVAVVLGARLVPTPAGVLRAVVAASWHARLNPLNPGWIDLAFAIPCSTAPGPSASSGGRRRRIRSRPCGRRSRAWPPRAPTPRPRRLADLARLLVTEGAVTSRRRP